MRMTQKRRPRPKSRRGALDLRTPSGKSLPY